MKAGPQGPLLVKQQSTLLPAGLTDTVWDKAGKVVATGYFQGLKQLFAYCMMLDCWSGSVGREQCMCAAGRRVVLAT